MNAVNFDEYKDQASVFLGIMVLDAMANEFIDSQRHTEGLEKAVLYTENWKSLGLGVLGFASYLQSKMVPWNSFEAELINTEIFSHLQQESTLASQYIYEHGVVGKKMVGYGQAHSHLCVTGDTKILTKTGQTPIIEVVGKKVEVWNGENWSEVVPFETGVSEVYRVKFSNGLFLDCTPDHRFLVATPKRDTKVVGGLKTIEVEAKDLRVGDCLPKFTVENSGSDIDLPYAYTAGLFCGDGSINNSKSGKYPRNELRLYGEKMKLSQYVDWKSENTWGGDDCVRGYLPDDILQKNIVPFKYSSLSKQQWLAGLIDADGCSCKNGISISTKHYQFAFDTALLIQSLGGDVSITEAIRVGGYSSEDNTYFVITLSQFTLSKVFNLFCPKRVKINLPKTSNKVGKLRLVEVVSVDKLEGTQMTYCFTEKAKGLGVFNGVLTKQCAIAPNLSSSVLAGQVSQGIEPWLANAFMQDTASGSMVRINPQFLKLIESKGLDVKKVTKAVIENMGSLKGLDKWFTEEEIEVFATAFEIPQERLIDLAAARQKFIDQGQSLNLFFSSEEDPKYIAKVHQKALLNPWIKGLYYCRSESGVQASKNVACESCAS